MNVLIVGCEKLGSSLASLLSRKGHDVVVIDEDTGHFAFLDDDFSGYTVSGVPFDRETLQKGGIQSCDCLAAVGSDDNTNLVVSQMAHTLFHVPQVITRIHDPRKNAFYSSLGFSTISPSALAADLLVGMIDSHTDNSRAQACFGNCSLGMQAMEIPKEFLKTRLGDVPHEDSEQVIGVQTADGSIFFLSGHEEYLFQPGDRLIFSKIL